VVVFARVTGKSTSGKTPRYPLQQVRRDWRLGARNRQISKVAGLRGRICGPYSVLLRGPRSRKNISKVGVNKSFEGMPVANRNISSLLIDRLSDGVNGHSASVIYLYCNFQTQKSQVTAHMLGSLLKQAVGGLDVIPQEIDRRAGQGFNGQRLSAPKILRLLRTALGSHGRTFICIDALDECATEQLPEFLRSLHSIVTGSSNVRLFMTGRPHIEAGLGEHYGGTLQTIQFKPAKVDIREYLEVKLRDDEFLQEMDSELRKGIMEDIPEEISEMYVGETELSRPSH